MAVKGKINSDAEHVVGLDGGWGWVVVVASLMVHVIADGVSYSVGLFVQPLIEYFDVGRADIGWLGSLMIGITWGSGPIASVLTNRFGCRLIAIIGTLVATVGLCLTILAPNIWVMYISFGVIAGFGLGLVYLPAIVIVSYYFVKRRSFAIGLAVCGSGLGTFVFAPVTQFLLDEYGWKGTLLIETGLLMNCFVCGALFRGIGRGKSDMHSFRVLTDGSGRGGRKETPAIPARFISPVQSGHLLRINEKNAEPVNDASCNFRSVTTVSDSQPTSQTDVKLCSSHSNSQTNMSPAATPKNNKQDQTNKQFAHETEEPQDSHPGASSSSSNLQPDQPPNVDDTDDDLSLSLKHPAFIMFAVSNFLTSIGYCVPYIFLPDRATLLGIDGERPAFLISAIGISNTVARIVFGYIADFQCVNRLLLYNTVLVLCGLATILSYFCTVFSTLVGYSLFYGLFMGIYTCLIPVVLVDLFGLRNLSKSFGLILLACGFGAVLGPPLAGWIFDLTQDYTISFYVMGAVVALSGAMLYPISFLKKPQRVNTSRTEITDKNAK